MTLVLVGASSYSVTYIDESGVGRRATVQKGQGVGRLNLSDEKIEELKKLTVRVGRTVVPMFVEMDTEPGPFHAGRHTVGGKISNEVMAAQRAENAAAIEAMSSQVEAKVEASAEPETKKAPAKKPAKKKSSAKKKAPAKKSSAKK